MNRTLRHGALVALAVVASFLVALLAPASSAHAAQLNTTDTQWNLAGLGYLQYSGVDGSYGPGTKAAVKHFQEVQLTARQDGTTDGPTSDCLIMMMKLVQKKVGANADGFNGPNTKKSIQAWQRANGLDPDGRAGFGTLAKMGIKATGNCRPATPPKPTPGTSAQRAVNEALQWTAGEETAWKNAYRARFGQSHYEAWCQDFVWYAWSKAGVYDAASFHKSHAVRSFTEYGAKHGTTHYTMASAKPGDAIVWDYGQGNRHVAIVIKNNGDGTLDLMHGNWNDKLYRQTRSNGYSWTAAYGMKPFTALVSPK